MLLLFLYGGIKLADYDVYHIEERLQELDPNILRVDFDNRRKLHRIICTDGRAEYTAMTVPLGNLDSRVVTRMMEINPKRGYNPFHEIDKAAELKQKRDESRVSDIAYGMADIFFKPLTQHAFYGR